MVHLVAIEGSVIAPISQLLGHEAWCGCNHTCVQRNHEQAEEQETGRKTSLAQGDANRSGHMLPRNRSSPETEAWCEMLACYSCLFSLWVRGSDCAMERPSQYDRWY